MTEANAGDDLFPKATKTKKVRMAPAGAKLSASREAEEKAKTVRKAARRKTEARSIVLLTSNEQKILKKLLRNVA